MNARGHARAHQFPLLKDVYAHVRPIDAVKSDPLTPRDAPDEYGPDILIVSPPVLLPIEGFAVAGPERPWWQSGVITRTTKTHPVRPNISHQLARLRAVVSRRVRPRM